MMDIIDWEPVVLQFSFGEGAWANMDTRSEQSIISHVGDLCLTMLFCKDSIEILSSVWETMGTEAFCKYRANKMKREDP